MADVIRWEDPPPHRNTGKRRSSKWEAIAAALRERPGQWAVVIAHAGSGTAGGTVHRIKSGRLGFNPAGSFEAVGRKNGDGTTVVYARYVGGERDG